MKVDEWSSEDGHTPGGGETPPCAGLISNALPEAQSIVPAESSQTGVSTRNALFVTKSKVRKEENIPHWFALRTTYGREKKAYDYMTAKGITAIHFLYAEINILEDLGSLSSSAERTYGNSHTYEDGNENDRNEK